MIEKMLCPRSRTLLDVMQLINKNTKGIAFIIDENKQLCGVVTDGDIRRALMAGKDLQTKVSDIVGKKFIFALASESKEELLSKINSRIHILPIVDENKHVIDYAEFRSDIQIPVMSPDLKGNEFKYLVDAFLSTWISSKGEYIERFEKEFANYIGVKYSLATSSGTTALHLALLGCGIGPGDEVIVPDLTFAATINAVLHAQASPVIVDVEQDSWCIDPKEIKKAITSKTKAIIPVHLYGQPCNMDAIMDLVHCHNLFVIEDAAEAHGALYGGVKVGGIGDIGCFSFYGNKIITCGEGGMCLTNNADSYRRMLQLRDHGMSLDKRYWHDQVGYNYRMTNLQAAIGVAQLERIDDILKERNRVEMGYRSLLQGIDYIEFQKDDLPDRKKITWLVSLLIRDGYRNNIIEKLKQANFDIRHFFYPLSEMDIYKKYLFSNKNSKAISEYGISLPSGANITREAIAKIAAIIRLR